MLRAAEIKFYDPLVWRAGREDWWEGQQANTLLHLEIDDQGSCKKSHQSNNVAASEKLIERDDDGSAQGWLLCIISETQSL